MFYGVIDKDQIFKTVKKVCEVLGNGKNNVADKLILGTIAVETSFGNCKDYTPFGAGSGLCQFDRIGFEEVMHRTRDHNREAVKREFGIDINKVEYEWLEYNA